MDRRMLLPLALLGVACATTSPAGRPASAAICLPCIEPCTPESSCGEPAAVAAAPAPAAAPAKAAPPPPAPKAPAAPTLSPAAGTFPGSQTVTISSPVPGASIHYTTDGSVPTEASPIYSGPISVDRSTTVSAVAIVAGAPPSEVVSAAYDIAPPPPPPPPVATPHVTVTKDKLVLSEKVYFDTAKATIKPVSYSLLDEVAAALASRPDVKKVRIEGHTDAAGDAAMNQRLSQRRAEAVREFLVKKGVEATRLEAKGFGAGNPVAPNTTAKGRESNRRVDFIVE